MCTEFITQVFIELRRAMDMIGQGWRICVISKFMERLIGRG